MNSKPEKSGPVGEERRGPTVRRQVVGGSLRILIAEGLILPTGLITAAFLTRRLGPANYGLFTLSCIVVLWMEFIVTSMFSRATVKLIGDAEDWQPWAAMLVRCYLVGGVAAAGLLWLLSGAVARLLGEPTLGGYLRLFALDIPIFSLASAHRDILVGMRCYRERALASAVRWIVRLVLIVALVLAGLSVRGAILAMIGASLVDFAVSRYYARPPLWGKSSVRLGRLWQYALPLFLAGIAMRLFDKMDLFVLKALGASAATAGLYGAAQNLTIVPGLIGTALAPVLLAALTHSLRSGHSEMAREVAQDALRFTICLLPFAALVAAAAPAITTLVLGQTFAAAAPFLAVLIFAGFSRLTVSVALAILVAAERPGWVLALTAPVVPLAAGAYLPAILQAGGRGAAVTTTTASVLLAVISLAGVYLAWGISPSAATWVRTALVSAAVYALALAWPATGFGLVLKLTVIAGAVPLAYLLGGEFRRGEVRLLRSALWPGWAAESAPPADAAPRDTFPPDPALGEFAPATARGSAAFDQTGCGNRVGS